MKNILNALVLSGSATLAVAAFGGGDIVQATSGTLNNGQATGQKQEKGTSLRGGYQRVVVYDANCNAIGGNINPSVTWRQAPDTWSFRTSLTVSCSGLADQTLPGYGTWDRVDTADILIPCPRNNPTVRARYSININPS